ncbi:MAG: hypothetical protein FJ257_09355 [Phycisphaerae bacterium]|nr:hypothetical protein [Phycisphaerae bacterium]
MSEPLERSGGTSASAEHGDDPREDPEARRVRRTLATAGRVRGLWRVIRVAGWLAAVAMLLVGVVGAVAWFVQSAVG